MRLEGKGDCARCVPAGITVDGHLGDDDSAASWNVVTPELAVHGCLPRVVGNCWVEPECFVDGAESQLEFLGLVKRCRLASHDCVNLLLKSTLLDRVKSEQLQRPREGVGRGLVASPVDRQDLVCLFLFVC